MKRSAPPLSLKTGNPPRVLRRRYPIGAEVQARCSTHFRVWAPKQSSLQLHLAPPGERFDTSTWTVNMEPDGGGYFAGLVEDAGAGTLYKFRLRSGEYPDPASRF